MTIKPFLKFKSALNDGKILDNADNFDISKIASFGGIFSDLSINKNCFNSTFLVIYRNN